MKNYQLSFLLNQLWLMTSYLTKGFASFICIFMALIVLVIPHLLGVKDD